MVKLLAVLVLAGVSVKAQTYTSGDWQYSLTNGEASISGYFGSGGAVTIPYELNGASVVRIESDWPGIFGRIWNNYFGYSITSITIPNSVRVIGKNGFYGLASLTNIVLPDSVTLIGESAFYGCALLQNILIPSNVTNIGKNAFSGCTKLSNILIPDNVASIGNDAFLGCSGLTNIAMPTKFLTEVARIGFSGQVASDYLVNSLANSYSFVREMANNTNFLSGVATNDAFVTAVANKILAASNNYGLATKTEVGGAVTMGVQQVLSAPSDYNLFTTQQVQNERTAGQNDVLNTPNSFSLYTTNQIHNLGLGGIVLNRNTNNQLVLNYQVLQSSDLQSWSPYQQTELVISNAPSDKMFLRVQAIENVAFPSQSDPLPDPLPGQPEGEGTPTDGPSPTPGAPTGGGKRPPAAP